MENSASIAQAAGATARPRGFTVESANRALVYVAPVMRDVRGCYAAFNRLRERRAELSATQTGGAELDEVQARLSEQIERLNELSSELSRVGCEMKDWEVGLVDFPARYEGRWVCLCWKLGETQITHWHEWDAGFAGRREVDDAFRAALHAEFAARSAPR